MEPVALSERKRAGEQDSDGVGTVQVGKESRTRLFFGTEGILGQTGGMGAGGACGCGGYGPVA